MESNLRQFSFVEGELSCYSEKLRCESLDAALFEYGLGLFKDWIKVIAFNCKIVFYPFGPIVASASKVDGIDGPLLDPQT